MPTGASQLRRCKYFVAMGSGASNSIKTLPYDDQPPEKATRNGDSDTLNRKGKSTKVMTVGSSQVAGLQEDMKICQQSLHEAEEKATNYEKDITLLQKQMGELECDNLALLDQVQQLEQQNECLQRLSAEQHGEGGDGIANAEDYEDTGCTETLHVKDNFISQLQQELANTKKEITKLKLRYKKKIRLLNQRLSESNQEHSFQVLELQNRLSQMAESKSLPVQGYGENRSDGKGDSRTELILDLSSKVSEQEKTILKLEAALNSAGLSMPMTAVGSLPLTDPEQISPSSDNTSHSVVVESNLTELQQVTREMKNLQLQKKKRRKKIECQDTCTRGVDSPSTGGMSSGCDSPSGWSQVDGDQTSSTGGESHSQWSPLPGRPVVGHPASESGGDDCGLDPSSIRRISAPKDRKKGGATHVPKGKPPVGVSGRIKEFEVSSDVDMLLNTLDQDIGDFPYPIQQTNHTCLSVISS